MSSWQPLQSLSSKCLGGWAKYIPVSRCVTDMLSHVIAGRMLRLRCKTKNGSHIMQGLTHQSCVQELKSKVEELTGIPCDVQKIMVGYPPSSLDLRNGDAHLKDYPIKSGMLIDIENMHTTQTKFTPFVVYMNISLF